jgi:aspartate aminotransferase
MNARLDPALERCLALQERFEQVRADALRRHGARLCDLAYANPHQGPHPALLDAIRAAITSDRPLDFQYSPYGGSTLTRREVARHASARFGCTFHWRDIVLTAGAMAALKILFRAVRTSDADEVVVITPCWMDYPLYLHDLGLRPVFAPLNEHLHLDLDRVGAALTPRTRAVVLSQPANPTGVIYGRDELAALAELLRAHASAPMLISDECHRDIRNPSIPCVSPAEFYDATCLVYSFGKSLFAQGQRIGYIAVPPRFPDSRAWSVHLERVCRLLGLSTPTALMQIAVRHLVDVMPDTSALTARRERTVRTLRAAGFEVVAPEATFFIYPATPDSDDVAFADRLARLGVLVLPAAVFHHTGHVRLSLTASDDRLDRALEIFQALPQRSIA